MGLQLQHVLTGVGVGCREVQGQPLVYGLTLREDLAAISEEVHERPLPAIAISAQMYPEDIRLCLEAGFADFVGKPVRLAALASAIDRQFQGETTQAPSGAREGTVNPPAPQAAASFQIGDILSDRNARASTFGLESWLATPYWAAAKTGTSKDMRDNWCAGYSRRYTVAVWVGNASGSPMHDVSGISGAAPVWREVMN